MSRKSLDSILSDVDEPELSADQPEAEAAPEQVTDEAEDTPDTAEPEAPKAKDAAAPKGKDDPEADDKKDGLPPWMHARVKAATEARAAAEKRAQELEQRLSQQQPQQEQQHTLQSYLQNMQMQMEQRLYQMSYAASRNQALAQYGAEEVAQAEAWAYEVCAADPQANQRYLQSQDPIGQAIVEYRKAQTFAELEKYGGDLNKLIEAKLAERGPIQTDEAASPQGKPQSQRKMPGNFSGQPSAQTGRSTPSFNGPTPLGDLLK